MSVMTRPSRRGFTLMEMTLAISVIAIVLAFLARLYLSCVGVMGDAERAQSGLIEWESALRHLRADVWSAQGVTSPTSHELLIETTTDGPVFWTWTKDDGLVRTSRSERRWTHLPFEPSFAAEPTGVRIVVPAQPLQRDSALLLVSQIKLLRSPTKGGAP